MNGGFAAGLADGLRNGIRMVKDADDGRFLEEQRDRARRQEGVERDITASMASPGLTPIAAAPQARVGSDAMTSTAGLDLAMANGAGQRTDNQKIPAVDLTGGAPASFGLSAQMRPTAPQSISAETGLSNEYGQMADRLTRGYRKALELGEPDRALALLMRREQVSGKHRQKDYDAAASRFEMTGDPSAYIPFLNRHSETGIEVRSITTRPEIGGGKAIYELTGFDPQQGKEVKLPFTEAQMTDYLRMVSDPRTAESLVAQRGQQLWKMKSEMAVQDNKTEGENRAKLTQIAAAGDQAARVAGIKSEAADPAKKPLPTPAVKMQQEIMSQLGLISSIDADLGAIKAQVDSGELKLGPIQNMLSRGRNAVNASDPNSRAYGSMMSTLEKLRNDSLRLNNGVQTEGDAIRAWNELLANVNDESLVSQRLGEIQRINRRAAQLKMQDNDLMLSNYGHSGADYGKYMNLAPAVGKPPGAGGDGSAMADYVNLWGDE